MRTALTVLLAACAGAGLMAAPQGSTAPDDGKKSDIVTLSGCVTTDPNARKVFTLADAMQEQTYRLTGIDVRNYVGQHVELLGAPPRPPRIVGGLYPNANVAAQAGSMDPTKAAMAAMSGPSANAQRPLVEFKVKSIRITPGACPAK